MEVVRTDGTPKVDPADAAKTEEGLQNLKKQLDNETSLRIAAEHRAQEAAESEARARGEVQGTQLDLIKNALEGTAQASKSLKAEYAAALAAQDFDAAAEVQEKMSVNAAVNCNWNRVKLRLRTPQNLKCGCLPTRLMTTWDASPANIRALVHG